MTFTSHFFLFLSYWRALLTAGVLALLAVLFWQAPEIKRPETAAIAPQAMNMPQNMNLQALRDHIHVFRNLTVVDSPTTGELSNEDFRFAGTFNIYNPSAPDQILSRRAVVSYRPDDKQYIVSQGDTVGGAEVMRIGDKELVLSIDDSELILQLGGGTPAQAQSGDFTGTPQTDAGTSTALATVTRFGKQTAAGTWQMDREALLAYYEELLNEPDRLLQVFDSMAPVYMEDGSINGYRLEPVGEMKFFEDVGLQEGDRVKAVNTLEMTNRRRAEFFIRQVVANDLNTVVLDIERNGSEERVVYEIK